MEIRLRRKYREVVNGRFGGSSHTGVKKERLPRTERDVQRADAQRRRPPPVMVLLPNGKLRMRKAGARY